MHKVKKPKKAETPKIAKAAAAAATTATVRPVVWPKPVAGKRVALNIVNANVPLPPQFKREEWQEIIVSRQVQGAHIPTDIYGLSSLPAESCDAIWNAGSLAYLYAHEVPVIIQEFHRILKPGGFVQITITDLQRVAQSISQGKLERELYRAPAGIITAIDLLYGHRASIASNRKDLQIKTGFTAHTIVHKFSAQGFGEVEVVRNKGFIMQLTARKVKAVPADKPLIRIQEEDLNEMMRARDNVDKAPEMLKITPEGGI